jgi:hypothetical protein
MAVWQAAESGKHTSAYQGGSPGRSVRVLVTRTYMRTYEVRSYLSYEVIDVFWTACSAMTPQTRLEARERVFALGGRGVPLWLAVAWLIPGVAGSWDVCAPE